jgi:hypothetical protein
MSSHDRHGQHRHGTGHKKARQRWAPKVRAGKVTCWRCGKPIPLGEKWDLGHVDEDGRERGYPALHPEHIRCNRATLPRMLAQARGGWGRAAGTHRQS